MLTSHFATLKDFEAFVSPIREASLALSEHVTVRLTAHSCASLNVIGPITLQKSGSLYLSLYISVH